MSTNYAINADGNMCRSFIAPLLRPVWQALVLENRIPQWLKVAFDEPRLGAQGAPYVIPLRGQPVPCRLE
jgi:hypothetical protein